MILVLARPGKKLAAEAAAERYEAERRMGAEIAARLLEDPWEWTTAAGPLRAARRADFLIEAAHLAPGVSCLELGPGPGEFTERLLACGCDLTAVDLSEDVVELCRERVDGRAEVLVGNVETGEGLEGRSFDAIVGIGVLHHVNLELCLRNTLSLLEPGGRFAFTEPNMANPQIWVERNISLSRRVRPLTPHETAFRPRGLRRAFEQAGFVVEVCEPFDFLHPHTPLRLIGAVKAVERVLEATPLRQIAGSVRIAGYRPASASA